MSAPQSPVLGAIVRAAVDTTAALAGWVFAARDDRLVVVAAAGEAPAQWLGRAVPAGRGAAGFVMASSQPLALQPSRGDRAVEDVADVLGRWPGSVIAVPCDVDGRTVGVLELVDKVDGGTFSFDDLELATLLAGLAAHAIDGGAPPPAPTVADPGDLARRIASLATTDPTRYARLAPVIDAILAHG
jgi:GAF domain-containing protein